MLANARGVSFVGGERVRVGLKAPCKAFPSVLPQVDRLKLCRPACNGVPWERLALRDPCETCHPIRMTFFKVAALNFVIPTGAKRSGGTCSFYPPRFA